MSKKWKKPVAIAALTIALLGGGSVVYAYWTATGAGTGTASAAVATGAIIINQAPMTPVTTVPQGLSGTFDNPGTGPVYVTNVTASIASVTKAVGAASSACTAADFTLTGATMPVGATISVGNPVGSWSGATIAFNSTAANQDGCKGATVTMSYISS